MNSAVQGKILSAIELKRIRRLGSEQNRKPPSVSPAILP